MKRVIFQKGKQEEFMSLVCNGLSVKEFIRKNRLDINYSTFKKYRFGRRSLPLNLFKQFCKMKKLNEKNFNFKIVPKNWGAAAGGKKGIRTLFKKYGNSIPKWQSLGGINSGGGERVCKNVIFPNKTNEKLAEFIGAHLGDGTLTNYFIRISGDKRYDIPYFKYLSFIIENLFNIKPSVREEPESNRLYLELRSKKICDFLQGMHIKPGDKIRNQTKIPKILLKNRDLCKACIRGLVDTDGSISKDGKTLSVRFSSYNKTLLNQVDLIGKSLGLFTFKTEMEVGTRSLEKVRKYFNEVGSSNLRHIVRFCESLKGNIIKKKEVLDYYNHYKDINLPFKMGL